VIGGATGRRAARALAGAGLAVGAVAGAGLALADDGRTDGGGAEVLGPGPVTVELGIEHSAFDTDALRVRAGTTVRFVLVNGDPIRHELIVGPPEVHRRHEDGTEAAHPPRPGEVTVDPQQTAATAYAFDEPGFVEFACHLPGHLAYGMVGTVEVLD
jgi:uncharacterized cupredoxin-like copper-binding protein